MAMAIAMAIWPVRKEDNKRNNNRSVNNDCNKGFVEFWKSLCKKQVFMMFAKSYWVPSLYYFDQAICRSCLLLLLLLLDCLIIWSDIWSMISVPFLNFENVGFEQLSFGFCLFWLSGLVVVACLINFLLPFVVVVDCQLSMVFLDSWWQSWNSIGFTINFHVEGKIQAPKVTGQLIPPQLLTTGSDHPVWSRWHIQLCI